MSHHKFQTTLCALHAYTHKMTLYRIKYLLNLWHKKKKKSADESGHPAITCSSCVCVCRVYTVYRGICMLLVLIREKQKFNGLLHAICKYYIARFGYVFFSFLLRSIFLLCIFRFFALYLHVFCCCWFSFCFVCHLILWIFLHARSFE